MTYEEMKKSLEKIRKETIKIAKVNYRKWTGIGLITNDGQYAHARMQEILDALNGIEMVL